jgi:hypothetical protein
MPLALYGASISEECLAESADHQPLDIFGDIRLDGTVHAPNGCPKFSSLDHQIPPGTASG